MNRTWRPFYPKTAPRKVVGGIRLHKAQGEIAETWWGRRWIEALESFGWHTRLERGKRYARLGQVASIRVAPGVVSAQVQGSKRKPYEVRISLHTFSRKDWARVTDALATKAYYSAKLLSGEMPHEMEGIFRKAKAPLLFPKSKRDLSTDCSCPDWENPCKHVAAVHYILAQELDRDPFLLFKIRGLPREELLAEIRSRRQRGIAERNLSRLGIPVKTQISKTVIPIEKIAPAGENLSKRLGRFFSLGKEPLDLPELKLNLLERLPKAGGKVREIGIPPFWQGEIGFEETLMRCYRAIRDRSSSLVSATSQRPCETVPCGSRRGRHRSAGILERSGTSV